MVRFDSSGAVALRCVAFCYHQSCLTENNRSTEYDDDAEEREADTATGDDVAEEGDEQASSSDGDLQTPKEGQE